MLYPSTSFAFTADFRRHKQMLHIDEKAKRMLMAVSFDLVISVRFTYQSAMLKPHMDFISRQVAFVAPIH